MFDFRYYTPTKVVFGKNTEAQTADLIREFGGKKVLIHYGGGSVIRSGLLKKVTDNLDEAGIPYVTLGGAVPNPHLGLVYEGIELCKKEGVDFLLAVGGGSAIDSAKAIGYGVTNEGDVWDFYDYKRKATACLPLGVILTIAATGSEMSDSSVITKEEGLVKRGYSSDYCRPKFAIMNPELTMTLPDYQTACGCTDIMMHTMERYFTNGGKGAAVTSGILKAAELGFTHVFQLDSDGQHDTSKIPRFLELSKEHPDSVICGCPEYDENAPQSRVKGREFANMWIHIVTLSKSIKDAMVGFRIYPIEKVVKVFRRTLYINKRMGFDIEILVRLFWANVPIISEPVKISYPKDGVSNFRMFWDNAGISETYTRLFLGMIPRLPIILFNALTRKK